MSVDGTKLLFEGFLQKRKDTMKIRWSTYWFRLQNTTLFFYTKKNGSASHLRGYYYMYTVQSVREVQRSDSSRRFMFEITMKNGKRKMLAAETAALRREWVQQLWEAMHLSFCRSSDCIDTNLDEREQRDGRNSSTHLCTHDNTVMESLPDGLISAPSPSVQINCETSGFVSSSTHQLQELDSDGLNYQQSGGFSSAVDSQEVIYDVLPIRKKICEINISTQVNEGLYDTPLSYKRPAAPQVPAESIYDIPSLHVREVSDHITEGHYEDICWRM